MGTYFMFLSYRQPVNNCFLSLFFPLAVRINSLLLKETRIDEHHPFLDYYPTYVCYAKNASMSAANSTTGPD
jgi:hypothetical protein